MGSSSFIGLGSSGEVIELGLEEICRMIAENSGIDVVLQCISDTGMQNNKAAAIALCSLLSKLAASDANKSAIVEKQGLNTLIQLSSIFAADPAVLQEIMSIVCVVSLRSSENAASAMEAGAGDLAVEAMLRFPTASQMQRQACLMIRNLVVHNPENRQIHRRTDFQLLYDHYHPPIFGSQPS
ncbi:Armadillo repeat-containing protein 6 [Nymphaea thermarum]|nr:Armadillo repeat-containing protein 6 [Nymphaea thermarum]